MPPLKPLWDLERDAVAIGRGLGAAEPRQPDKLEVLKVVQLTADLHEFCPLPLLPARLVRLVQPAVVGNFSILEIQAVRGEVEILYLKPSATCSFGYSQVTNIQNNRVDALGSFLGEQPSAFTSFGDRNGSILVEAAQIATAQVVDKSLLRPIPPGWILWLSSNAINSALTADLHIVERAGHSIQRAENS